MLECFFSCAFFDPSATTDHDEFTPQQDPGASVTRSLDPDGPLFTQDPLKEPSILQFLYERVPHSPVFKQQLFAAVEHSRSDSGDSRAAANAMAILVKAQVRFNGADLRGIKISGADLFGGQFDTAKFQGADLTNVNLTRTWIRQVDFTGAEMTGACFGVLPLIEEACPVRTLEGHSNKVLKVAFSPDGCRIASASVDTTVRVDSSLGSTDRNRGDHHDSTKSIYDEFQRFKRELQARLAPKDGGKHKGRQGRRQSFSTVKHISEIRKMYEEVVILKDQLKQARQLSENDALEEALKEMNALVKFNPTKASTPFHKQKCIV
ncbi:MAG: hypothetical protein J3R72DRAFT_523465 [Linnemannia gamsii]|nr:MAG: hypothetical protein J3R72DRAFT_523465 [Linnemannia gamsii]